MMQARGPRPKEDVLEQIVEDYLQHRGYFTVHNIRFRPDPAQPDYVTNQDAVYSDVDVVRPRSPAVGRTGRP